MNHVITNRRVSQSISLANQIMNLMSCPAGLQQSTLERLLEQSSQLECKDPVRDDLTLSTTECGLLREMEYMDRF